MLYRHTFKRKRQNRHVVDAFHGFFGSGSDFQELQEHCNFDLRAWDLLGFGNSLIPDEGSLYSLDHQLDLIDFEDRPHLLGYSMGGRLALQWAVQNPDRIQSLVLIGAHPGIKEGEAKKARREWDMEWSRYFATNSIEACWQAWSELPLIKDQCSTSNIQQRLQTRLSQDPRSLSWSMRYFGSGCMTDCWKELSALKVPVLLIAGERDLKYIELNRQMAIYLPQVEILIQSGAGHAPHFEQPESVGRALSRWYQRF
ncbi:MAG: 2-succinyl-6-hydroxy-2,4-cyclohexadiene-1-carboxylate synthase [Proteobacteria bacterium]|nr:2-succinyl-6-hydroxy-2,4-cyclohexadiene-1-carboxylate synthase [Pseudomonadota bacterium]